MSAKSGSGSLIESIASLPAEKRERFLERLTNDEAVALWYDWRAWARPEQLPPPGEWRVWLILAGRGWGKTRTEVEWLLEEVESGRRGRLAIVGRTAGDVRDVLVEGESGILRRARPWFWPKYEPTKRRLTWPNGAVATTFSADEPDSLRGPQHDGAIADELAAWRYPEAWDQLMFGLRIGSDPRCVVATTPRPIKIVKELVASPTTVLTGGSTFENAANLAPAFIEHIVKRYEGTTLGRQELYAEILSDNPSALWKREGIDATRVNKAPELVRVVVAVDPAVTSGDDSAETGIVVAGVDERGEGYVLDDLSLRSSPHVWGSRAVTAYYMHQADRIVAEANNGGDMVELTIRTIDDTVPYKAVYASRGKRTRAEPVAALYEQGKVHHVGMFGELEDQLCQWTPGDVSPDRLDALVWALTELMLEFSGPLAYLI